MFWDVFFGTLAAIWTFAGLFAIPVAWESYAKHLEDVRGNYVTGLTVREYIFASLVGFMIAPLLLGSEFGPKD